MRCRCFNWSSPLRRCAPPIVLAAGLATDPAIDVRARLVVASPISTTAITAMQAEVERIWDRYGVNIRWFGHGQHVPLSMATVEVLVGADPRERGHMRPAGPNTLGCFRFVRDGDSRPVITIFPQPAQRLAGAAGAHLCGHRCLEAWLERLQGTLLGRALAHEIGHYLLGPEHTSDGLMRPEFRPREVLAGELEPVSLTGSQVQRLSLRRFDAATW